MNLENSLYKVNPGPFQREITVPTSKSYANRALILGAILGNQFKILNLPESSDVENLISAFQTIGLKLVLENQSITFLNSFPSCESETKSDEIEISTGDGGTTNRFLIALLSRGQKKYVLRPSEKIVERPIDHLIDPLKKLNCDIQLINKDGKWLSVKGPIQTHPNQELIVDCSLSTQFASACKLAFFDLPIKVKLIHLNSSQSYNDLTDFLINEVKNKKKLTVPVDFSSMSYPVALGVICGSVKVLNCFEIDSYQADSTFLNLLNEIGADLKLDPSGFFVSNKNSLQSFDVDGSKCLDLIMTLVFLASQIDGTSYIRNVELLKHKESDRLEEIKKTLTSLKVPYSYDEKKDILSISKMSKVYDSVTLNSSKDHRIVMMNYLFLRANGGGSLDQINHVNKSFPSFFEVMD